jgi:protein-serine/threonine kinase
MNNPQQGRPRQISNNSQPGSRPAAPGGGGGSGASSPGGRGSVTSSGTSGPGSTTGSGSGGSGSGQPDDYVYFNRSVADFSAEAVPKAKAAQLKLEHFYKLAVEAAVERNTR